MCTIKCDLETHLPVSLLQKTDKLVGENLDGKTLTIPL
jgi:hypothetical protein